MKNILLILLFIAVSDIYAANVALNKPTEATAEAGPAFLAVDGDFNTCWNAADYAPPEQRLTVDLQNIYSVNQIDLWVRAPGMDHVSTDFSGYYVNYNLYISTDKNSWQFISSGTLVDTLDPYKAVTFSPTPVRYVRYDVTGGTHWAHLHEMQVFSVPEPATIALFAIGGLMFRRRKNNRNNIFLE